MQQQTRKQEAAEDIFFGQVVLIWARWFVIAAGMILALWQSQTETELILAALVFAVIIGVNFFVHGRFLMEKPINQTLLLCLSLVDLVMVTMIVLLGDQGPVIENSLFVFYYPFLVAFAFVFPQRYTAVYTALTLLLYGLVCILAGPEILLPAHWADLETVIMRLITMAAVGGLGTYYWRMQRERRRILTNQFQSAS